MRFVTIISAFVLIMVSHLHGADSTRFSDSYGWPMKYPKQFSSGFGDARPGRFHMGVDLRTGGVEGEKVYSPEDGYVVRIKTSYQGYGKALYIRGKSGRTYVFGHLSTYNWDIGSYLQKRQIESKRYFQDIYPKQNELPVKKGQFVARSGQTGVGAPHLHFEVRGPDDRPTNPLYYNDLGVIDKTPPKIEKVWISYCDDHSLFVSGDRELGLYPEAGNKPGEFFIADTIVVTGTFSFKAAIDDYISRGSFLQGPSRLLLYIDGILYHGVDYDRLDFEENKYSLLANDFDPAKLAEFKRVFNLYRYKDSPLTNYFADGDRDGTFTGSANGFHDVRIEVTDHMGNVSTCTLTFYYDPDIDILAPFNRSEFSDSLLVFQFAGERGYASFDSLALFADKPGDEAPEVAVTRDMDAGNLRLHGAFEIGLDYRLAFFQKGQVIQIYRFSIDEITAHGEKIIDSLTCEIVDDGILFHAFTSHKSVTWLLGDIESGDGTTQSFFKETAVGRFDAFMRPMPNDQKLSRIIVRGPLGTLPDTLSLNIWSLKAGKAAAVSLANGVALGLEKQTLFGNVVISTKDTSIADPKSGRFVVEPFEIFPPQVSFADWADLQFDLGKIDYGDKVGLYVYSEDKGWLWAGGEYDAKTGILHTPLGGGGVVAVITDTIAPAIVKLSVAKGGIIKIGRPTITCQIEDELSGIADDLNFDVTIDKKYVVPEFDFEQKRLKLKPYWRLPEGKHSLRIKVTDRCGNENQLTRKFIVRAVTGP